MTLSEASAIASITSAAVGVPANLWLLYRVCQGVKLLKRRFGR